MKKLFKYAAIVLMAGMELPAIAIREQISSAINIVVQTARLVDGQRKITKVSEVTGMERDVITLQDIFEFKQTGIDGQGNVIGFHQATCLLMVSEAPLRRQPSG